MKNPFYILLVLIVFWGCNKCKEITQASIKEYIYVEPNKQSIYYQDTVLVFQLS